MVKRCLARISPVVDAAASEAGLRAHLCSPDTPEQDIASQLIVVALIERYWRRPGHSGVSIPDLHRALFGDGPVDVLREDDHVADFGGLAPTPWQEIGCRIDELDFGCRALGDSMASAPLPLKAHFLAYVFSSIIRIHPFPDGNGRTARMYVQYLLRRWGHPYMV